MLVRVDFNVPLKDNRILDTRRIESTYKTIDTILKKGATPILIAHLGSKKESLKPIARFLSKKYKLLFIGKPLDSFIRERILNNISKDTVVLFENIRRREGEEKNDPKFAKFLASLGDFYVNDAFSASHRRHASIVGVPKLLPSFAGYQLQAEIKALSRVLEAKEHPFLFIIGGMKFDTKIPLLDRFSHLADNVVIAGAILNNFYKTAGFEVGASVVEKGYDVPIKKLLKNHKLLLPTDVIILRDGQKHTVAISEVKKRDKIVDIGPDSTAHIIAMIKKAKLVVWNGPTGWYEGGFDTATVAIAKVLTTAKAHSVIGGGDTAAVIQKMLSKNPSQKNKIFLSTGGGATLDFLANGTLPGVQLL